MKIKRNSDTKKLNLRRESLRALTVTDLNSVRGGPCGNTHRTN